MVTDVGKARAATISDNDAADRQTLTRELAIKRRAACESV